ncbi:amidohydrolase, partial [bacterium]|nr:amidohydrolase [bacterium]
VRGGAIMASADEFIFTVVGRGGHGAIPQQTIDAIPIAAQVISALQTIVSRNVDPNDPAVLSIGQVNGGSNFNIIAQEVRLRGTVRTLSLQTRAMIKARIEQVAGGICRAMGADYRYEWIDHYPVTINDDAVADVVAECARDVVGTTHVVEPDLTLGAEDVSYFLREVPGCYFFLGSADEAAGKNKPHHHPEFDFDERVMPVGVEIFARVAEHYTGQRLE